MGSNCNSCCANTDGDTDFQMAQPNQSNTKQNPGVRRSTDFNSKKGALSGKGLMPMVSRSGNHFDFKNGNGALARLDVYQVMRLQSLVRGYLQRKKYRVLVEKVNMAAGIYFKKEELFETLKTNEKYNPKAALKTVKHTYSTGAVYEGQMRGGFREGKGKMTWVDGGKYDGEWKMGFACGKGTFHHADEDVYEGQWFNNKCNGYGVYTNKKGARYEGQWKNDTQSGQGTEMWPEGSKYVGQYENGKKQGYGTYSWADGSVYQGDWVDNRINGVGQYQWKDGRQYYGNWYNNDMHGMGIYIYTDGVTYEGQYKEDKKTGFGLYFWTDGRKYEGWWYNGKQHGLGIYKDPSKGKVKYGLWEHGKRITWFNPTTIYQINEHQYAYDKEFKDPTSKNYLIPNATFNRPEDFDEEIDQIKQLFKLSQA